MAQVHGPWKDVRAPKPRSMVHPGSVRGKTTPIWPIEKNSVPHGPNRIHERDMRMGCVGSICFAWSREGDMKVPRAPIIIQRGVRRVPRETYIVPKG